jgi:hypothetical protein
VLVYLRRSTPCLIYSYSQYNIFHRRTGQNIINAGLADRDHHCIHFSCSLMSLVLTAGIRLGSTLW